MFCIKCGTNNLDEAAFCMKCGRGFEPEEETRVAVRGHSETNQNAPPTIFSITPTMKFVTLGYILAVIAAFLAVAILTMLGVPWWISIPFGMLLLLVPAFYHVKQKLVRYTLHDTILEIDRGLISRSTQNVPLRRVQDVTVSSTLAQRVLGLGDLVIDNASEHGGKVILKSIDSPRKYADILLKQMRQIEQ